jgi:hypothetical protein
MLVRGDEPRRVMDNWFRADARISGLDRTLRSQGRPLPAAASLYHDLDVTVLTRPFSDWHVRTLGSPPDPEVVDALAAEWMEGALPETWFSVSPARVRFQRELIGDWIHDDPVTRGVIALLPEWVRWLGERAGLFGRGCRGCGDAGVRTRRRCRRRRGSREVGAPGGVQVGEEGFVLLVGLERVDGCGQLVHRLDRADCLSMASSSVGTKSSAVPSSGCSGVLVTGHLPFGSSSHLGCTP